MEKDAMASAKAEKLRIIPYALAMFCFFLPFCQVSCGGERIATFSGLQIMTGQTSIEGDNLFEQEKSRMQVPMVIIAGVLAFLAALAGALFYQSQKAQKMGGVVCGGLGVIALLILSVGFRDLVSKASDGMIDCSWQFGYYGALLLLLIGAVWNACLLVITGTSNPAGADTTRPST